MSVRPQTSTAFISYSTADREFVTKLAADLRKHNVGVWLDCWEIKVGDSITRKINDALCACDYLVIVLSPHSVNSQWVQTEFSAALMRDLASRQISVLPILYQDCDIPPLLRGIRYADMRGQRYDEGLSELLEVLRISDRQAPVEHTVKPNTQGGERTSEGALITPQRRSETGILGRKRGPTNWEKVAAIVGILALLVALGQWWLPEFGNWITSWLSQTPTNSSQEKTPIVTPEATLSVVVIPITTAPSPSPLPGQNISTSSESYAPTAVFTSATAGITVTSTPKWTPTATDEPMFVPSTIDTTSTIQATIASTPVIATQTSQPRLPITAANADRLRSIALKTAKTDLNELELSPDGHLLLTSAGGSRGINNSVEPSELLLWDTENGKVLYHLQGHASVVKSLAFSPDGQWALSGSEDGRSGSPETSVILWDLKKGAQVRRFEFDNEWTLTAFRPDGFAAVFVSFTQTSTGLLDSSIIVWDFATAKETRRITAEIAPLDVSISADGRIAAVSDFYGDLFLWNLETGMQVQRLQLGSTAPFADFSPDGSKIAQYTNFDPRVVLWDLETSQQVQGDFSLCQGQAAFSSDGRTLICGAEDGALLMVDIDSGKVQRRIYEHAGAPTHVVMSSDGTTLASGDADGTIRIWREQTD